MAIKNAIGDKPLTVPEGGTGNATFTQNGILVGNGTSAISSIDSATNGQLFIGATAAAPAWASLVSGDSTVTITPAINSVTLSASSTGNIQTWTPTLSLTGTTPSFTYSRRSGQYIQVGNLIYFNFDIATNNNFTGGSGNFIVTGLPGIMDTSILSYFYSLFFDFMGGATTTFGQFYSRLDTSTGIINAIQINPNTNNPAINVSSRPSHVNSGVFSGSGYYFIV